MNLKQAHEIQRRELWSLRAENTHTHFLDHPEVDFTNNVSERCARKYKRKQQQMVTFRSPESMVFFCDALSVIETNKLRDISPYSTALSVFNR